MRVWQRPSRQLALAAQPQPLFGFELCHAQEMAQNLQPVAFREFHQFGNSLRNEGHGLVGAALLAGFIQLRSLLPTGSGALPTASRPSQKFLPKASFWIKNRAFPAATLGRILQLPRY